MDKKFYRYELVRRYHSGLYYWDLELITLDVQKETPQGYWIKEPHWTKCRWVSKGESRKKFARETKKRALECFIYRTSKRMEYLELYNQKALVGWEKANILYEEMKKEL